MALTAVIPRDSPKSSILVEVGKSSFDIGDQDATTFQAKYMEPECDNMGCDSGSPQSFQFVTDSDGTTDQGTATIQMSGYISNDSSVRQILLSSINTAMLHTGQCSKVSATKCIGDPAPLNPNPSKRESGPVALDCGDVSFGHCTIANFIQATLYGNDSSVKAQMTFQGSSVEPQGFDCGSFLGSIQDALGAIPLGDIGDTAGEVINGITAICHLIGI